MSAIVELTKISDIIIDPETQVREDLGDLPGLAADIKQNGLINEVEVRLDPEGRKHLVAGLRRVEAFKLNREEFIPTKRVDLTAKDAIIHTVSENIARNNYTPKEEALAFKAEVKAGWHVSELAIKHGRKQEYIKDRLDLLDKLDPKVLELIQTRKLGIETAKALEQAPKELQPQIARKIVSNNLDLPAAKQEINMTIQQHEELQEFRKLMEKSEFKTCPTCTQPPIGSSTGENSKDQYACCPTDQYSSDHVWNLRTGKTRTQETAEQLKREKLNEFNHPSSRKEERVSYAFRYDVPVSVIREAMLNKAVAESIKRLKDGAGQILSMTIDDFRFEVRNWASSEVLQSDVPKPIGHTMDHFSAEPQNYQDGNLTKINPNHTATTQKGIDQENEKLRKWLNSLPEISEYRKKHRGQKALLSS